MRLVMGREGLFRLAKAVALLICVLVTALTFVRFLFVPLGLAALGRHWGYFVNYFEFGFIRRGFVGSVLYPFLPSQLLNDFLPLLILFPFFLFALLLVALRYIRSLSLPSPQKEVFFFILILSPALLPHYAYSTGDFNALLALTFIASLLLLRRPAALIMLLSLAMLVHEIFLIAFVPAICVALYVKGGNRLQAPALYALAAFAWAVVLLSFGSLGMGQDDYSSILRARVPNLDRDGYYELTWGFAESVAYTLRLYSRPATLIFILPALLYWALSALMFFPTNGSRFLKYTFIAAAASPLVMLVLGSDLYRWISLAAVATIVLGGFLAAQGLSSMFTKRPWLAAALLVPWILLGPIGSACDPDNPPYSCERVFPIAQFAFERFFP